MRSVKSRRLRKKLYLDEFAVLGFEVSCSIAVKSSEEFDLFLDQLVSFVEGHELMMGGGNVKEFSAFICSEHRYISATNEDRDNIGAWLNNNESVNNVAIGELVDANYGI
ncbi:MULTISPECIES: YggL family protein [unclassified Pseudoalteromonas]|uniref:YggL 50S ribosome-binding family protein n=1 Tax=unclassified Pseudoalteromonas TaxID=194690 RepID=UPI000C068BEC|nr:MULTISPECIES: YggL family protein [unclassified Pseudoalteromonas]MDP2634633.1 YggL family protein [Pseudoalteromonas sp. 1_MG-2023]PHN91171.1 hypothetical protein CSC79_02630 [Pseudoalteromonas sp. 3D05]